MASGVPNKYIIDFGIMDMYKTYKKNSKNPVTKEQYNKIIGRFNSEVANLILAEAFEFRMPYRLGYLRIKKTTVKLILDRDGKLKKNYLRVDWASTKKMWEDNPKAREEKKLIYHLNKHTDGYYFRWYWDKSATNVSNISVYKIIPARKHLRAIAQLVNTKEDLDYYA